MYSTDVPGVGRNPFEDRSPAYSFPRGQPKGPGKQGHIVADKLLPTQMFPRFPARATFVADTNFVPGTQKKMFLILFTNSLCPQQMFSSLRSQGNITGDNASATMCPRHSTRNLTKGKRSATTMKTVTGKLGSKKSISCYVNLAQFGGKHRVGFSLGIIF